MKEDPAPVDHSLNIPSAKGDGGASGALAENAESVPAAPSIGNGTEHTMEGLKGDPLDLSNWWDEADVPGDKTAHDGDAKVDDAGGPHTAPKHSSGSAAHEGDRGGHSKGGTDRDADEGDDRGSGASDKDDGAGRAADEGDNCRGASNEDNGTGRAADTGDDRGSGASDEDNGTVRAADAGDDHGSGASDEKDNIIGETPLAKWDACNDAYQAAWDLANASLLGGETGEEIIPMLDNKNDQTLEEFNNMFLQQQQTQVSHKVLQMVKEKKFNWDCKYDGVVPGLLALLHPAPLSEIPICFNDVIGWPGNRRKGNHIKNLRWFDYSNG